MSRTHLDPDRVPMQTKTTQTLYGTQTWKQVGWIGQTGMIFSPGDNPFLDYPFKALWVMDSEEKFDSGD